MSIAQTRDTHLSFGDNRHVLLKGHGSRPGPQWQHSQDPTTVLGGNTSYSYQPVPHYLQLSSSASLHSLPFLHIYLLLFMVPRVSGYVGSSQECSQKCHALIVHYGVSPLPDQHGARLVSCLGPLAPVCWYSLDCSLHSPPEWPHGRVVCLGITTARVPHGVFLASSFLAPHLGSCMGLCSTELVVISDLLFFRVLGH